MKKKDNRGGPRKGTGRPKGTTQKEPTVVIRVPKSKVDIVKKYIKDLIMKTIILLSTLLISITAYSQRSFYLGAGATTNSTTVSSLGYYASGKVTGTLNGRYGYSGSLIYMNQASKVGDVKSQLNSISGEMLYTYSFLKSEKLKVMAGFQLGIVTTASKDNKDKGLFSLNAGASYDIGRFEILAKYMKIISENPFDNTVTLGAGYKFR